MVAAAEELVADTLDLDGSGVRKFGKQVQVKKDGVWKSLGGGNNRQMVMERGRGEAPLR